MKITAYVALLFGASFVGPILASAKSNAQDFRGLEETGEAAYVDHLPIGATTNLLVTVDLLFEDGDKGGITYFTLDPPISGATTSVTCTATAEASPYDMGLILRKGTYPTTDVYGCSSASDTSAPDTESCSISGFYGETLYGLIYVTYESGQFGNGVYVDLTCTAGVVSFCDATTESGGFGTTMVDIDLGTNSGTFTLYYNMYFIPDQLTVKYEGSIIYATPGLVSGENTVAISYSGSSTQIQVIVVGEDSDTEWEFSVTCPVGSPPPSSTAPPIDPEDEPRTAPPTGAPRTVNFCFSERAMLNVLGKGPTLMKDLDVGDKIQAGSGSYETVYGFAHLDKTTKAEFLQIFSDHESDTPLEVTKDHLLLVNDNFLSAEFIKVGDTLQGIDGAIQVTGIKNIARSGLYAPLTPSGTLVVNGVLASNYVLLGSTFMELQGSIAPWFSQHFIAHMFLSPLRIACMGVDAEVCSSDWIDKETGHHRFAEMGRKLVEWADNQTIGVQLILLGLILTIWGLLYAIECMVGAAAVPSIAVLVIGLLAARKYFLRTGFRAIVHDQKKLV